MRLPIRSILSLLLFAGSAACQVMPAHYFFMAGATNYLKTNIDEAKKFVTNGLAFYPQDPKLTNLWALLNQQQEQQQDKQDKKDEQKQEQQKQEQQSQEQKAQDQRGQEPDKSAQQAAQGRVMQMTPQEAQHLLDEQRSEERAMIFQPQNLRTNKPKDRVFKDW